jgi:hypothetical protein
MSDLFLILQVVETIFDQVFAFLAVYPAVGFMIAAIVVTPNFPPPTPPEEQAAIMSDTKRWHGPIDDRAAAIYQMVGVLNANVTRWMQPGDLRTFCTTFPAKLEAVLKVCSSRESSRASRADRDELLNQAVAYSLGFVRMWAYGEFAAGSMTSKDLHALGFLVPGETSKHRARAEVNDVRPETKIRIYSEGKIMVVIDQAIDKNAAEVHHGWPTGVHMALISIFEQDGKTEVYHKMTTHLHTRIEMPEDSHGKIFLAKAAFLKHVDDTPDFGTQITFEMPRTTQDLLIALDNQHQEDVEQHRKDVEAMEKEMKKG